MSNPQTGAEPLQPGVDPLDPVFDPPPYPADTTGSGDPYASAAGGYAVTGVAVEDPAPEAGSPSTTDVAKDEAANVKDTAVDAGKQVAATAKDEAANVVGEAKEQAKSLLGSATSELKSQASTQQGRLAGTVRGYADELQGLTSGEPQSGPLTDLVQQLAGRGSDVAAWLEDREPADVLDEVRRFARRRPVLFLALCGAAGVVAGRITRGAVAANTSVDSPKPARAAELPVTTTETAYAPIEPAYAGTGSTYGSYTDASVTGNGTEGAYTTDPAGVGYANQGDPIR